MTTVRQLSSAPPQIPLDAEQGPGLRLIEYLARSRLPTPVLVVDLDRVEARYRAFRAALPEAAVYYAVKANPAPEVIRRLVALGCHFDVASLPEIDATLAAGADPAKLSFGNTIKKERDIAAAFARGVRTFAVDAAAEVEKVARAAPGARVFCRLLLESGGAEWPLSRKFGCTPALAIAVLRRARDLGLVPHGLSFHVGSQQTDPDQWDVGVRAARGVFDALAAQGIGLAALNIGGGFPARYRRPVAPLRVYGQRIRASLRRHFGDHAPHIVIEPGRGLVGDAGVIETEVVLISEKGAGDGRPWVFVDVGKFGGLAETMDESIQYPIVSDRRGPGRAVILAGPTCDSMDILYERATYELPSDLQIGDRLRVLGAGAYTRSYSAVEFNGFAPLRVCCI
jgi:ornithine decarboxylase